MRVIVSLWVAGGLLWIFAACLAVPVVAPAGTGADAGARTFPNGVAAGDVDQTSVVLWARSVVTGVLTFRVGTLDNRFGQPILVQSDDPMQPVTVTVTGLTSGTAYRYRVEAPNGAQESGTFRTPAAPTARHGLRFGVSGDWRGSLAPFIALGNVPGQELDFFVVLGDTIYADRASAAVPASQAITLDDFRRKHAEVYTAVDGLNTLADLRAATAIFATIDDHEVTNDFAGGAPADRDPRFPETEGRINTTQLYNHGLQAFAEFNPLQGERYGDVGGDGRMDGAPRLYRYRRFGLDAALFLLDARSFRDLPVRRPDRTDAADVARFRADTFRPGRTMLGAQQLTDLQRDLLDAQARGITWKFIAIPEPAQIRGLTSAQDRFEGYAAERTALLQFIADNAIANVVFIAADIHGTLVNNITYSTGPETPQIALPAFEVTTGPVAYAETLGPVVIIDGRAKGYVTAEEAQAYLALPIANDPDNVPDDRDDFVKAIIDRELIAAGYDPLGLEGAPVDATLLAGDYVALHTYGWTEFSIDAATQALTVTTFGIPSYVERDLDENRAAIEARVPVIVSQFRVTLQSQ